MELQLNRHASQLLSGYFSLTLALYGWGFRAVKDWKPASLFGVDLNVAKDTALYLLPIAAYAGTTLAWRTFRKSGWRKVHPEYDVAGKWAYENSYSDPKFPRTTGTVVITQDYFCPAFINGLSDASNRSPGNPDAVWRSTSCRLSTSGHGQESVVELAMSYEVEHRSTNEKTHNAERLHVVEWEDKRIRIWHALLMFPKRIWFNLNGRRPIAMQANFVNSKKGRGTAIYRRI